MPTDPLDCLSSTRVPCAQGSAAVYQARADEAEARRGVPCRAETLAMDQYRKWLTKWRLKSADFSIMRDSHLGISGIKGLVPSDQSARLLYLTVSLDYNKHSKKSCNAAKALL